MAQTDLEVAPAERAPTRTAIASLLRVTRPESARPVGMESKLDSEPLAVHAVYFNRCPGWGRAEYRASPVAVALPRLEALALVAIRTPHEV